MRSFENTTGIMDIEKEVNKKVFLINIKEMIKNRDS